MSEPKRIKVSVTYTEDQWRLITNELRRGADMALKYGNKKMANAISDIRLDLEYLTGQDD